MNSDMPLVTIGAINYNNGKYVLETLESINAQTYSNIELVIVDDCSTDNSIEIIDNWLINYNKPHRFIKHEKNLGVCATCNDVLKYANGKYISTIATDDLMLSDKIKIQLEILENSDDDVAAVYSDAYLIKEDSSPRYGWFIQRHKDFEELPSGNIYNFLIEKGNFLPAMSMLSKTKYLIELGGFDNQLCYEDYDMWLRLARSYRILFSDYVSIKYRIRASSLSYTIKNWTESYIKIYQKHLNSHPIAIKHLEDIAVSSFYSKNYTILKELKIFKGKSAIIDKALFFSKFKLPKFILYKVKFS